MSEILKEDNVTIENKEYILRTIDLTGTPFGGIEYPYEQLLYLLGEEDKAYRGRLLDRCSTKEDALASHEAQVESIKNRQILLDFI